MGSQARGKPHAICIPYRAQGHVNPMLKLAKLLYHKGFHITFVNTEYNHKRLLRSQGPHSLDGLPHFRFDMIPDGLPPSDADSTQDIPSLCASLSEHGQSAIRSLLLKLQEQSQDGVVPPVTCIVSDGAMTFTLDAAEELKIPEVVFGRPVLAGGNLRTEDLRCLPWLDSREPGSVVYVNFGSVMVMTAGQLTVFAWGLANSQKPFLWIIRPDLVAGESAVLLPEFMEEIKSRGMLVSWGQQEEVLKHQTIGGFPTHSGWNSTLESLCSDVPMICWPFFVEQQTNCRYSCMEWGIGMEIDNDRKRDEVEGLARELMEGENGKEMRKKAMEWKAKAEAAIMPGGTSYNNVMGER
ncbi:hypothetical protein EUGRSUZ_L00504 [Eucalyptus grandis]|uniref:Uncharacterized protein n=1 Tax=Eucalyptus grandis TaxID=71139 RepID=A0ACC3JJU5_EUCGR|nr:hypothetical protein EUGRSUZ_L00504 [Eucalyptus grandis]